MPKFVEAVNANGVKQTIPADWLDVGSPFADQFKLPPSTRTAKATKETKETKADEGEK